MGHRAATCKPEKRIRAPVFHFAGRENFLYVIQRYLIRNIRTGHKVPPLARSAPVGRGGHTRPSGRQQVWSFVMQIPLQVAFHGLDKSEAVEERIREKVNKLEKYFDRIVACRVVIEAHHRNASQLHHKGEPFHVAITLSVPGEDLIVKRDPKDPHEHEDIGRALKDAFAAMERQLKDFVDRKYKDHHKAAPDEAEIPAQADTPAQS